MFNIYRKDFSWLHFNTNLRAQKRQKVKDQQSYISVSVVYPTYSKSSWKNNFRHENSIPCKNSIPCRFGEINRNFRRKKPHKKNKSSNILGSSFFSRGNVRAPIWFTRERQFRHLKRWFFLWEWTDTFSHH